MGPIAGILDVRADGVLIPIKGNFEIGMGNLVREAIMGANGVVLGYKETPTAPFMRGTAVNTASLDLAALANMKDVSITARANNGKIYVLREAFAENPDGSVVQSEEGEIAIGFGGTSCDEIS